MAENDAAVKDLGNAYIYLGPVGAADPTVAEINAFSSTTFGAEKQTITVTGGPTGGDFTLTAQGGTTGDIPWNATAAQIMTALVALPNIDASDVIVTGGPLPGSPVVVTWTGRYQGQAQTLITVDDSGLTGGTTPEITVAKTTLANGMLPAGHTSLDNDFSPIYEGGERTVRGSRQNASLKEQVAAIVEGVEISLIQVDEDTLTMFYGGGSVPEAGKFKLPTTSTPIERSFLIVYLATDGTPVARYYPKVSIGRTGSIRDAKGGWMEFPIRVTFLELAGREPAFYGAQIEDDTP
ncbi:phage tail tube protein [Actinosynnema sp. NPDC004786]